MGRTVVAVPGAPLRGIVGGDRQPIRQERRVPSLIRTVVAVAAAGTGALAYAGLVERRWYRLRHATVPALRDTATRPLRILHLSDLHLLPRQGHKHDFVRACISTGPDLVVATGDFLGHPEAVDDAVALLAPAAEGRPALGVLGSNDVYAPSPKNPVDYLIDRDRRRYGRRMDTARLVDGLREAGWTFLDNRRTAITTAAGEIDVAGLGDAHVGWDHPEQVDWRPPTTPVALRLGVLHAPYLRALDVFAHYAFDLVLAGHTHGGQLRVPLLGALVTNCDLPLRQARGLSRHEGSWLHVSAGLGTSMYAPVRFSCPPEATLLDVVPA
ncbi:MAG TPA: metallophosphoesterase [Egibacteraceae bacterium]